MKSEAFTLVELLVVVAVIGILATLAVPAMGSAGERARSTACQGNLRQMGLILRVYLDENGNRFPTLQNRGRDTNEVDLRTADAVLTPKGPTRIWKCPSDRKNLFEETGSSYFWNNLLNGQAADRIRLLGIPMQEAGFPVISDKSGFHAALGSGRAANHLYSDGAVKQFFVLKPNP